MTDVPRLRIRGADGAETLALARRPAGALPGQVPDVGTLLPKRAGSGAVRNCRRFLAAATPGEDTEWITFACDDVWFAASVPLAAVVEQALVVHSQDGGPLPREKGGPFRLLIPDAAKCHTARDRHVRQREARGRDPRCRPRRGTGHAPGLPDLPREAAREGVTLHVDGCEPAWVLLLCASPRPLLVAGNAFIVERCSQAPARPIDDGKLEPISEEEMSAIVPAGCAWSTGRSTSSPRTGT